MEDSCTNMENVLWWGTPKHFFIMQIFFQVCFFFNSHSQNFKNGDQFWQTVCTASGIWYLVECYGPILVAQSENWSPLAQMWCTLDFCCWTALLEVSVMKLKLWVTRDKGAPLLLSVSMWSGIRLGNNFLPLLKQSEPNCSNDAWISSG